MRSERVSSGIIAGLIGGLIASALVYVYVSYKLNHFGNSKTAHTGIPVTIPGTAVTSLVSQFAAAGGF